MNLSQEDGNVSSDMSFHDDDFDDNEVHEPSVKYRKKSQRVNVINFDGLREKDSDESPILSQKSCQSAMSM